MDDEMCPDIPCPKRRRTVCTGERPADIGSIPRVQRAELASTAGATAAGTTASAPTKPTTTKAATAGSTPTVTMTPSFLSEEVETRFRDDRPYR